MGILIMLVISVKGALMDLGEGCGFKILNLSVLNKL
jgi:hypothetical protein